MLNSKFSKSKLFLYTRSCSFGFSVNHLYTGVCVARKKEDTFFEPLFRQSKGTRKKKKKDPKADGAKCQKQIFYGCSCLHSQKLFAASHTNLTFWREIHPAWKPCLSKTFNHLLWCLIRTRETVHFSSWLVTWPRIRRTKITGTGTPGVGDLHVCLFFFVFGISHPMAPLCQYFPVCFLFRNSQQIPHKILTGCPQKTHRFPEENGNAKTFWQERRGTCCVLAWVGLGLGGCFCWRRSVIGQNK